MWDAFPGADPDTPGPGQYYDAEKDAMVAGRGPSFTIGGGKDDVGKVPSRGGEDVPGPGAYDVVGAPDDGDVRGSRNKGFTFGGKVGVDWASAGPGRDAPAVGKYFRDLDKLGGDVRDSVKGPGGRGPAFSFGTAPARPRDDPTTGPGPGDYHRDGDDDTNANDAKTEKDAKTKSNRSGFTFGYRREPGDGGVGPGPGAYQPNVFPEDDDPDALRQGPAFTLAPKLRVGGAVDVSGDKARVPGPGEYDADGDGVGGNFAGPAFTVSGKVPGPSGEEKRAREVPGPGQYADAATVGEGAPAFTMYARVEDPTLRASSELPGPGAYGVPVAPGAELSHPTRGAASVRGREAWANTGWGAGAEDLPVPRSTSRAPPRDRSRARRRSRWARGPKPAKKVPVVAGRPPPVPGSTTATGTSPRAPTVLRSRSGIASRSVAPWVTSARRRRSPVRGNTTIATRAPEPRRDRRSRSGSRRRFPRTIAWVLRDTASVPVPENITTRIANRPSAGTAPGSRCTSVSRPRGRRRRRPAPTAPAPRSTSDRGPRKISTEARASPSRPG